uniref:Uncharacterized protein n=1 Tax=Lepeophtheirus salmonis TaxID=72036 RepID=A0A0K2T785_LEPSM
MYSYLHPPLPRILFSIVVEYSKEQRTHLLCADLIDK